MGGLKNCCSWKDVESDNKRLGPSGSPSPRFPNAWKGFLGVEKTRWDGGVGLTHPKALVKCRWSAAFVLMVNGRVREAEHEEWDQREAVLALQERAK